MKVQLSFLLCFALLSLHSTFALSPSPNFVDVCLIQSTARGQPVNVGQTPRCEPGFVMVGNTCYGDCRPGYVKVSEEKCAEYCPGGFRESGTKCFNPSCVTGRDSYYSLDDCADAHGICTSDKQLNGYIPACIDGKNLKATKWCSRNWHSVNSYTARSVIGCPQGSEQVLNLCYPKCPTGLKASGATCKGECPYRWNQCGNMCIRGKGCGDPQLKKFEIFVAEIKKSGVVPSDFKRYMCS